MLVLGVTQSAGVRDGRAKPAASGRENFEPNCKLEPSKLHLAASQLHQDFAQGQLNENALVETEDGKSILHVAVVQGNAVLVQQLLDDGAYANAQDVHGWTPLHCAAALGHAALIALLVECHASLSTKDKAQNTPLHLACKYGHAAAAKALLQAGAPPHAANIGRQSPMLCAAEGGHEDALCVLLACRVRPSLRALHVAARSGRVRCVTVLVAAGGGVDLDGQDEFGQTALHIAAGRGHVAVIEALLQAGADANIADEVGDTPLHFAAAAGQAAAAAALLLDEGRARVDARNSLGATPLHVAARRGQEDVAEALLQGGADLDVRNREGSCALHYAALMGHAGVARALLDAPGVDVGAVDKGGATPLHHVVTGVVARRATSCNSSRVMCSSARDGGRHMMVAQMLQQRGADAMVPDTAGATPLDLAQASDCLDLLRVFIAMMLPPPPLDQPPGPASSVPLSPAFSPRADHGPSNDIIDSGSGVGGHGPPATSPLRPAHSAPVSPHRAPHGAPSSVKACGGRGGGPAARAASASKVGVMRRLLLQQGQQGDDEVHLVSDKMHLVSAPAALALSELPPLPVDEAGGPKAATRQQQQHQPGVRRSRTLLELLRRNRSLDLVSLLP